MSGQGRASQGAAPRDASTGSETVADPPLWRTAVALGLCWLLVAALNAGATLSRGVHPRQVVWALWWILAAPAIAAVAHRLPLNRWRALLAHAVFGVLLFLAREGALALGAVLSGHDLGLGRGPARILTALMVHCLVYFSMAVPLSAISVLRATRHRETIAARQRAELSSREVAMVLDRVGPRELAARLATIREVVDRPAGEAAAQVLELAEQLRRSLSAAEQPLPRGPRNGGGAAPQEDPAEAPARWWWDSPAARMLLLSAFICSIPLIEGIYRWGGQTWLFAQTASWYLAYLLVAPWLRERSLVARHRMALRVVLTAAGAFAAAAVFEAMWTSAKGLVDGEQMGWSWLLAMIAGRLVLPSVLFTGAALFDLAHGAHEEAQRLALQGERVRLGNHEARLRLLRAQLHPHFLFNALQSLAALLERDRAAALYLLARLESLYAHTLRTLDATSVPFADEIAWSQEYLAVERGRFFDRLEVSVEVDPQVLAVRVPPLILQPLVENAIHHGVARHTGANWVRVLARREGSRLVVTVRNRSGGSSAVREGFGLRHTRRRLEEAYGEAASLRVRRVGGEVVVVLALPCGIA